jgi:hypothetical protein
MMFAEIAYRRGRSACLTRRDVLKLALALLATASTPLSAGAAATASDTNRRLRIKSVDVMKLTKDVVTHQPGADVINAVVKNLKIVVGPSHIAISVPLDPSGDYPPSSTPAPQSAEAFTQTWCDAIHGAGMGVLFRGTFCGIEGLYGFTQRVGSKRLLPWSAWIDKSVIYILNNSRFFQAGDIWAPLPERTEGIFQDATSFLPYDDPPGIQQTYVDFFGSLQDRSVNAFAAIGRQVEAGLAANNYSEVASGWLMQSLFDHAGVAAFDHYGLNHTPAEMDADLRSIYGRRRQGMFLQEWADYWNGKPPPDPVAETSYLENMYGVCQQLVNEGKLEGFNYWGGWPGAAESILNSDFSLNYRGNVLARFFRGQIAPHTTDLLAGNSRQQQNLTAAFTSNRTSPGNAL